MRKLLLVLGVALATMTSAEPLISGRNSFNLKGITFCIDPKYVVTSDSLEDNLKRDFSTSQYGILKTKLTAYRVPVVTNCYADSKTVVVVVVFDNAGPIGTNDARNWTINLLLVGAPTTSFPDGATYYSDWSSGVILNYSLPEEKTYIAKQFSDMIDLLAASYAIGNPLK